MSPIGNCYVVSSNAKQKKELKKQDKSHKICRKLKEITNGGGELQKGFQTKNLS
jgi:hypothetical protein